MATLFSKDQKLLNKSSRTLVHGRNVRGDLPRDAERGPTAAVSARLGASRWRPGRVAGEFAEGAGGEGATPGCGLDWKKDRGGFLWVNSVL